MHGNIYDIKEEGEDTESKVKTVLASFGGLLMKLVGDPRHLEEAEMGSRLYILMKRIVR